MIPAAIILFILAVICFAGALWQGARFRSLTARRSRNPALRRAIWDASRFRWIFCFSGVLCMLPAIILLVCGLSQTPADTQGNTTPSSSVPGSSATTEYTALPSTETTVVTEPTTETHPIFTPPASVPEITWMTFPDGRELESEIYFVYSCDADVFITTSGSLDQKVYPASITKLFTAYVALQILDESSTVTVGDAIDLIGSNSSRAWLSKGNVLTRTGIVTAMLLPSGNDAAYALADAAGRVITGDDDLSAEEAVAAFVKEMNRQATVLGLNGTHFVNPDGWHDEQHYTCPRDLAVIAKLSLEDPIISKCVKRAKSTASISKDKTLTWENTNSLLQKSSDYYCPISIGLKTGSTTPAGNCLLSAFTWDENTWVIGTFRCSSKNGRYLDTLYLLNTALDSFR